MLYRAGGALLVRGVEVGGKFILYFAAAHLLGGEQSGFFFLCLTYIHILSTLARMGIDRALIRHVSAELAVGAGPKALHDIRTGLICCTAVATAISVTGWFGADLLEQHVFSMDGIAPVLAIAALAIVPQTLNVVFCAILVGLDRSLRSQFLQNALWPMILLALLACGVRSASGLVLGFAIAGIVGSLICLFFIFQIRQRFKHTTQSQASIHSEEQLPALTTTAFPLAIVEVVQVSISNLPVLILGMFALPVEIAAFSVASRITQLVWVALISFNTIAAPRIGSAHRLQDFVSLKSINRTLQALGACVGGSAAILMVVLADFLLSLVGDSYNIAINALIIMAAGQFLNALLAGQDVVLAMTGHGRILRRINLMQFATCAALSLYLIPIMGMSGAAIAAAIPLILGCIMTAMAVRWVLPQAAPIAPTLPSHLSRVLFGQAPLADTFKS